MIKQYQVNCALNKEQYITLLKYCKENDVTTYQLVKKILIEKCNLPQSGKRFCGIDYDTKIKELESE